MSLLLTALVASAAPVEVTTGTVVWQIRRIGLADLKEFPLAALALGARLRGGLQVAQGDKPDPVKTPSLAELGPALAKSEASQMGFLCAGVTAVRKVDEEQWTSCSIVINRAQENVDAHRLHFLSLLPEWREALAAAILAHAIGEGVAADRLASFLGKSPADA